jgi:hypothetical protein
MGAVKHAVVTYSRDGGRPPSEPYELSPWHSRCLLKSLSPFAIKSRATWTKMQKGPICGTRRGPPAYETHGRLRSIDSGGGCRCSCVRLFLKRWT